MHCASRASKIQFLPRDAMYRQSLGVSCGVVCAILRLAVLVEHRLVTDRRPMASTADAQLTVGLHLKYCSDATVQLQQLG